MTIAISIKVHDGVVLAADSASTLVATDKNGQPFVLNVYNNANKIANLYKGLPIGSVTWGAGSIGQASMSTLAKDLRRRLMGQDPQKKDWALDVATYTVEDVAKATRRFVFEELYEQEFKNTKEKPVLGLMIVGYSAGQGLAEEWEISIQNGKCDPPQRVRQLAETGLSWRGEPEALTRLIKGHGTGLGVVFEELGLAKDQIAPAVNAVQQRLGVPLAPAPMPIQDVIELARFLAQTAESFSRFTQGATTVGGPIEIAAITKHEGYKWVDRKLYWDPKYNG